MLSRQTWKKLTLLPETDRKVYAQELLGHYEQLRQRLLVHVPDSYVGHDTAYQARLDETIADLRTIIGLPQEEART
jgi:hypothetical protein